MSKTYVITGGSTGIGNAVLVALRAANHRVINIDLKGGDITADLADANSLKEAVSSVYEMAPDGLDGLVTCAGLGPDFPAIEQIVAVNYFGSVDMFAGLVPLLEKRNGKAVVVSSNSAVLPGPPEALISALVANDKAGALAQVSALQGQQAYAGSKNALLKWARHQAPTLIKRGVHLNAVAPGITKTPLTDKAFGNQDYGPAMEQFLKITPYGAMATADMIAKPILFLLSDAAEFVVGAVLFVDGGTDALMRAECF